MINLKNRGKFWACCFIALLIVLALLTLMQPINGIASAEESSMFIFTATSEDECSVRLSDKSVNKAIIPQTAYIDGKRYTVTSIAVNGFASAKNLEKVRLPESIKSIGNSAFANCQSLSSIALNAVESIGTNAFNLCVNLEYLIIPKSVKTVNPTILRSCNTKVYSRISEEDISNLV